MGSFLFITGAMVLDVMEQWTLVLIALLLCLDVGLGFWRRIFWSIAALQVAFLTVGLIWARSVLLESDVAGPYASATVVGGWILVTLLVHSLTFATIGLAGLRKM